MTHEVGDVVGVVPELGVGRGERGPVRQQQHEDLDGHPAHEEQDHHRHQQTKHLHRGAKFDNLLFLNITTTINLCSN